jgi:hypothetical protein
MHWSAFNSRKDPHCNHNRCVDWHTIKVLSNRNRSRFPPDSKACKEMRCKLGLESQRAAEIRVQLNVRDAAKTSQGHAWIVICWLTGSLMLRSRANISKTQGKHRKHAPNTAVGIVRKITPVKLHQAVQTIPSLRCSYAQCRE